MHKILGLELIKKIILFYYQQNARGSLTDKNKTIYRSFIALKVQY